MKLRWIIRNGEKVLQMEELYTKLEGGFYRAAGVRWVDVPTEEEGSNMRRQEALDQLKELQASTDTEAAHGRADDILCALLRRLGHDDVVEAYNKIKKWYA